MTESQLRKWASDKLYNVHLPDVAKAVLRLFAKVDRMKQPEDKCHCGHKRKAHTGNSFLQSHPGGCSKCSCKFFSVLVQREKKSTKLKRLWKEL